uniref:Uncharacterized protein n=1 Tax=Anguilla anguilla TaxID=7936 RepID=A0A0E9Q8R6_ANGAN
MSTRMDSCARLSFLPCSNIGFLFAIPQWETLSLRVT